MALFPITLIDDPGLPHHLSLPISISTAHEALISSSRARIRIVRHLWSQFLIIHLILGDGLQILVFDKIVSVLDVDVLVSQSLKLSTDEEPSYKCLNFHNPKYFSICLINLLLVDHFYFCHSHLLCIGIVQGL